MIRIALVEDEDIYVKQMQKYLEQYSRENGLKINLKVFGDGEDILEYYTGQYDIILLDIQMQFMDGMTAAEKIRELDPKVILIFVTNMVQYAVQGYSVDAMDYILKPVDYFMLSQRLNKAVARLGQEEKHYISLRTKAGICKVALSDILYVESQKHQLCYVTPQDKYISRGGISDCEEALKSYGFYRVHKGYIVNMRRVDRIEGDCCHIQGESIIISREKKKGFMQEMLRYIGDI